MDKEKILEKVLKIAENLRINAGDRLSPWDVIDYEEFEMAIELFKNKKTE